MNVSFAIQVLVMGLAAFFVARLLRTLDFVQPALREGIKPFACNLCMSTWSSVGICAAWATWQGGIPVLALGMLGLMYGVYAFARMEWLENDRLTVALHIVALLVVGAVVYRWMGEFLAVPASAGVCLLLLDQYSGIVKKQMLPPMGVVEE